MPVNLLLMLFQWSKRLPRDISLKIVIIHKANIITVSQLEKCSSTGSLIWFYKLFNSTFYYALVINSYFVAHTVRCYAQCLSFVAHVRIKKYEYQNHAVCVLLVVCICMPYSTVYQFTETIILLFSTCFIILSASFFKLA